jgi:hypothetical protein
VGDGLKAVPFFASTSLHFRVAGNFPPSRVLTSSGRGEFSASRERIHILLGFQNLNTASRRSQTIGLHELTLPSLGGMSVAIWRQRRKEMELTRCTRIAR